MGISVNTRERRGTLQQLLRTWRGRLRPEDVHLPASVRRRRVPGLRSAEVAELVEVSTGWYEQFESGNSRRNFSGAFVERVATALRLSEDERATLLSLALPEVAAAAQILDARAREGALRYVAQARDFVRRLAASSSFEEASRALVEAAQTILGPDCATVASVENGYAPPRTYATGPRARFVGPVLAQSMLDMNDAVRGGAVVMCEDSPHPRAVTDHACHPVRIKAPDGREIDGMHDTSPVAYRSYNRRLLQRSELVTGLFDNGAWLGVMSCSWTEPREHLPIEIATIETLVAMVALTAAPFTGGFGS
jgi:transcriptional regulator with XRE-family HTH domain